MHKNSVLSMATKSNGETQKIGCWTKTKYSLVRAMISNPQSQIIDFREHTHSSLLRATKSNREIQKIWCCPISPRAWMMEAMTKKQSLKIDCIALANPLT